MAVRSRSRFVQAEQRLAAVVRAQERGQSMTAGLAHYRRYGGSAGRDQWRSMWRAVEQINEGGGGRRPITSAAPTQTVRRVKEAGGYIYNVQLWIRGKDGKLEPQWWPVKTTRPMSRQRVIRRAARDFEAMTHRRGYGYKLVGANVSSREQLV